jgi:hypothetical protein
MSAQQDIEVLLVRPKQACQILAIGQTRLFELLNSNELESFREGGGRWISVASIRRYVLRRLEEAQAS